VLVDEKREIREKKGGVGAKKARGSDKGVARELEEGRDGGARSPAACASLGGTLKIRRGVLW